MQEGYECQCCPGFVGPHCEEQDACYPNPCKNNGICVDISQGHEGSTFQCLCPYGKYNEQAGLLATSCFISQFSERECTRLALETPQRILVQISISV